MKFYIFSLKSSPSKELREQSDGLEGLRGSSVEGLRVKHWALWRV